MIKPDLHLHSTFSDGVLSPALLVEKAVSAGVTHMAVTDHDTLAGADSLRGQTLPIPVLTGLELSLRDLRGLHLLCYGDTAGGPLRSRLTALMEMRVDRARRMVALLAAHGMALDWTALRTGCRGTVGRAHIARALRAAGYVGSVQEAFAKYLGEGCPCYVPGERLSMAEALPLARESGFVPVLAHPALLAQESGALRALLRAWKEQGLQGVEVYHPAQPVDGYEALLRDVRRLGLFATGGSDFHQDGDSHGAIGCMAARWLDAEKDVSALLDAMAQAKKFLPDMK